MGAQLPHINNVRLARSGFQFTERSVSVEKRMIDSFDYFDSLCQEKPKSKKVKCLKCGRTFTGSASKRICSHCKPKNYFVIKA
jgi:rubrerythrin